MAAGWRPTRALLAFLVVLAAGSTGALRSLAVRSGATPLSFTLPLKMRPGQFHNHEARALLVNGTLPLHGAVKDLGYFYTNIALGTPPKKFAVIVDTGSTMTAVPCSYCKAGQCGSNKLNPRFDPEASSSFETISCKGDGRCKCGSPSCGCTDNQCSYSKYYAESSSSSGHLVSDVFHIGNETVRVSFGCETQETGEIYKQAADGIMGLGASSVSIPFQIADAGSMESMFSLCFGDMQGEGAIMFGDVPLPYGMKLQYVPLIFNKFHPHYYNINLQGMTIGNKKLNVAQSEWGRGYGTVLDSGTTFTYFIQPAFLELSEYIKAHVAASGLKIIGGPDPHYKDICWGGAPFNPYELRRHFPTMKFHMENGFELELEPINYLFIHTYTPGGYCLGIFDNGSSGTLLGGITFRNVLVQYDRRKSPGQVGFAHAPCRVIGQGGCWPPPETPPEQFIGVDGDYFCSDGGVEVEGPPPDPSESSDISVGVVISRNWVIIAGVLTVVAIVLLAIGFSGGKRINQMGYDRNQRDRQLRQLDLAMPESCGSEGSGGTMLEDISLQTPTGDTDFHGSFGNGIGMPGAGAVASQSLGIRSSASGLLGAAIRRLQGFEHVPSGVSSPASATPRSSEPRVVRGEIRDDNNRLTNRSRSSDDES